MKILLAPDKFKHSLSAMEVCLALEEGILKSNPSIVVKKCPLSDGGEGSLEVIKAALEVDPINCTVTDPIGRPINTFFLYNKHNKTAYIELAKASGLELLEKSEQDCTITSTTGTGELINHALDLQPNKIILFIGGSATNDGGMGIGMALGTKFINEQHEQINPVGGNLNDIVHIDLSSLDKRVHNIKFIVATDVTNLLYGVNGAAYIYAPQKGASKKQVALLDNGLKNIASIFNNLLNIDHSNTEGAGAAGGVGFGMCALFNAQITSGIGLIMKELGFENSVNDCDLVITGEGKMDAQTIKGKVVSGVANICKKNNKALIVACGVNSLESQQIKNLGINHVLSIHDFTQDNNDAMINAHEYLKNGIKTLINKLYP